MTKTIKTQRQRDSQRRPPDWIIRSKALPLFWPDDIAAGYSRDQMTESMWWPRGSKPTGTLLPWRPPLGTGFDFDGMGTDGSEARRHPTLPAVATSSWPPGTEMPAWA